MQNPDDNEDDCAAAVESDIEQGIAIEDPECTELRDVSAAPIVPRLIRLTWK
jgi:hypothetical protein